MTVLVLASSSTSRATLLAKAGVPFEIVPAHVDEETVKESLLADGASFAAVADALAELKAVRVSQRLPEALVLGGDLVIGARGRLISKCETLADARALLLSLRGGQHELYSAAVLAKGGAPIWRHVAPVRLWMRDFSEALVDAYIARHGESLLHGVGCYRIEDDGLQFFDRIDGDYFSIVGLPLLALLAPLREHGVLAP